MYLVWYYGMIFNHTGTVRNIFLGTELRFEFFPGSNYEKIIVPYRTASLARQVMKM